MSVLDLSFIGLLSGAILCLIFGFLLFFLSLSTSKKWKELKNKRIKNKKKRKRLMQKAKQLETKKKRQRRWGITFLILVGLLGGSAFYSRYYQLTNLTVEDSDSVAKSYYLVDEIKKQIESVENGASSEKTLKNLKNLTTQLASANVRKASQGMSKEGQQLLNKHFTLNQNFAVNMSNQNQKALETPSVREEYLKDIEKIIDSEKKVFKHFKINESALKQEN